MAEYWIKLYLEIIDDPKMAVLPDRLWRRCIELFLLAGKTGKDGALPDTRQLAWMLRMQTDDLELDLQQLSLTGIVIKSPEGWMIPKFLARQSPSDAAERKRFQRDRERHEQYEGRDDNCHANVTNRDKRVKQINRLTDNRLTDTESDTDTDMTKTNEKPAGDAQFKAFLEKIKVAFSEKPVNHAQIESIFKLRGIYGEDKCLEAFGWYAVKGVALGDAIARAKHSLPTWDSKPPPIPGGNGRNTKQSNLEHSLSVVKEFIGATNGKP